MSGADSIQQQLEDTRFEILGVLGEGGCATVYEALDRKTRRVVALKVLLDGGIDRVSVARLAREARAASTINHPNVCAVLGAGRLDDGRPYVAMELLTGETLREYLRRKGGVLSAEEAIEITVQILSGLEAAHAASLVHRDVKPENVFVERRRPHDRLPRVLVLDFGMCRRAADGAVGGVGIDERTLTALGSVVGTPGYLAPEQANGVRKIDPRIDLFAVGIMLFEMLTGRRAYRGANPMQLVMQLLATRLPSVRVFREDVPMSLDRIVAHATEHDPRARYTTAARFLHDLLEARTAMRHESQRQSRTNKSESGVDWNGPTRQYPLRDARAC